MQDLREALLEAANGIGIDLLGIASSGPLLKAPEGYRPTDILPGARSVVVIAMEQFDFPRLDRMEGNRPAGVLEYSGHFHALNVQLDIAAYKLGKLLRRHGFNAVPIPAGGPYDEIGLRGALSHKHAAVEAGLGEFGLSSLLITPQYGPRVRLASVVTDAPLTPGTRDPEAICENMRDSCGLACAANCPVGAIAEDGTINKPVCHRYIDMVMAGVPKLRCGICIRSCPIGKMV